METPRERQLRVGLLWIERANYAMFRALKVDPRADVVWVYGGDPRATFAGMAEATLGCPILATIEAAAMNETDVIITSKRGIHGVEFTHILASRFVSDAEVLRAAGPRGIAWEALDLQSGARFLGVSEVSPDRRRQAAELGERICGTWRAALQEESRALLVITNGVSDYWVFGTDERAAQEAFPRLWHRLLEPAGGRAAPAGQEGRALTPEERGWCHTLGLAGPHVYAAPAALPRGGLRAWLLVAVEREVAGGRDLFQAMLREQYAELVELAQLLAQGEGKPNEES